MADGEEALAPREREVLTHRFGLNGEAPKRQAAIARDLEISREAVRQSQNRALKRLRLIP